MSRSSWTAGNLPNVAAFFGDRTVFEMEFKKPILLFVILFHSKLEFLQL